MYVNLIYTRSFAVVTDGILCSYVKFFFSKYMKLFNMICKMFNLWCKTCNAHRIRGHQNMSATVFSGCYAISHLFNTDIF